MEDNVQIWKWVCNKRDKTNLWKKHKLNFSHHHWNSKKSASRRMHRDPLANYSKFKMQWEAYEARRKTGREEYLD